MLLMKTAEKEATKWPSRIVTVRRPNDSDRHGGHESNGFAERVVELDTSLPLVKAYTGAPYLIGGSSAYLGEGEIALNLHGLDEVVEGMDKDLDPVAQSLVNQGIPVEAIKEVITPEECESLGGTFLECESACRHDKNAEMCTMQCVQVCDFK